MHWKGLLILICILVTGIPAISQFQNILIYEQEGDASLSDPTISIHPRNTNVRVAGSAPGNVYHTKDGGMTWTTEKLSSRLGVNGDPVVVAGPKGTFHYFFLSNSPDGNNEGPAFDRIVMQTSQDGGVSWSAGESLGFGAATAPHNAWVTVDAKGSLYVTWTQFGAGQGADTSCASNVLFSMSKNGKKWSNPVVLSQVSGNCLDDGGTAAGASTAVTFDGKVVAAWSHEGKLLLDRSFNGGSLWLSNDIPVADQIGSRQLAIPGHPRCNGMPVLVTDISKGPFRGSLYLVWADQRNGENDTDIWFTRSHNYGDNWTTPMRIHKDDAGKHQYSPWLAVDQETGYLYVMYYDRRNHDDLQTDVYLAYSTDGGASFKDARISDRPFIPVENQFPGDRNHLSAHGGFIAPVWTRMDEGKTSLWTASIRHEDLVKAGTPEKK